MKIEQTIETIKEWKNQDWNGLKKILKNEYKKTDTAQQYNYRSFLEAYKKQQQDNNKDIRNYIWRFATISAKLYEDGKLDNYTWILWFVQGLFSYMHAEFFFCGGISMDNLAHIKFENIICKSLNPVQNRRKMKKIMTDFTKETNISTLVKKCEKNFTLADNITETLFQPSIVVPKDLHEWRKSNKKEMIDEITKMMKAIFLSLRTELEKTLQDTCIKATQGQFFLKINFHSFQWYEPRQNQSQLPPDQCLYCKEQSHQKKDCSHLTKDIQERQ